MTTTNLVVAIVFAALFGAAIVWLAIYYLHRYIHTTYFQILHWLQYLIHDVVQEDYGREKASSRKSRSASGNSSSPSRSRSKRERKPSSTLGSPRARMRQRGREWDEDLEIPRPPRGQHIRREYYLRHSEVGPGEGVSTETATAESIEDSVPDPTPPVVQQMGPQLALPRPIATETNPRAVYDPGYVQPYGENLPEKTQLDEGDTRTVSGLSPEPVAGKTDYIHICDSYPPIVLEAIARQAMSHSSSSSSSLSLSSSSTSVQEIPRAYIPRNVPRTTFQFFPRYPSYLQNRLWNTAPTSYPRQWMGLGDERQSEPVRYAPHVMRASGERRKARNANRRRLAPSFEVRRPSMSERRGGQRVSTSQQVRPVHHREPSLERSIRSESQEQHLRLEEDEVAEASPPILQRQQAESDQRSATQESELNPEESPEQQQQASELEPRLPQEVIEPDERAQNIELTGQPILLGPPIYASESALEAAPVTSPPSEEREDIQEGPVPPSTLISSLHTSDVVWAGSRQRGAGSGSESEQMPNRSSEGEAQTGESIANIVALERDSEVDAVLRGGESDILSTLGWMSEGN